MGKVTTQQAAAIAAISAASLQQVLFTKYPSFSSGTFHSGMIHQARKKNRRGKIIRRKRSMNIK